MKKYIVIDGINGDTYDANSLKSAKEIVEDIVIDGDEMHPDAESVFIARVVRRVHVKETRKKVIFTLKFRRK